MTDMGEKEFNSGILPELTDEEIRETLYKTILASDECSCRDTKRTYDTIRTILVAYIKLRNAYKLLLANGKTGSAEDEDELRLVQSAFNEIRERIKMVDLSHVSTPIRFVWDEEQKEFICRQTNGTVGISAEVEASAVNICGEVQTRLELFDRQLHELKVSKENRKELSEKSGAELAEICLQHADDGDLWSGTAEVLQECARRLKISQSSGKAEIKPLEPSEKSVLIEDIRVSNMEKQLQAVKERVSKVDPEDFNRLNGCWDVQTLDLVNSLREILWDIKPKKPKEKKQ